MEIEQTQVIRMILQYLRENNLNKSLHCLQEESLVVSNSVDNLQKFKCDFLSGQWAPVLRQMCYLKQPQENIFCVYEQCVLELAEMGEIAAAKALLKHSKPLQKMKQTQEQRYSNLEHQCTNFNFESAYPKGKQKMRQIIMQQVIDEIQNIPNSQLINLIKRGMGYKEPEQQEICEVHMMKFEDRFVESVSFSEDGKFMATGSSDGTVEIWDPNTAKLMDLSYQQNDKRIGINAGVLCVGFNTTSELIAAGAINGQIKLWQVSNGQCLKSFFGDEKGVTCLSFHQDQIIVGGFDGIIRVFGSKSGSLLKESRSHSGFINMLCLINQNIVSASSDGTISVSGQKILISNDSVYGVFYSKPILIAVTQSKKIVFVEDYKVTSEYVLDLEGDYVSSALSKNKDVIFVLTESHLCLFDLQQKQSQVQKIDKMIGIQAFDYIAIWSENGLLKLLK